MEVKVSVIVPCYNHSQYLKECIGSIENQSFENWECIIVNDGSTDETEEVAVSLTNEKVHYVYQENKGLSGARNTGIRHAKGEFILPLDADDTLNPQTLEKAILAFEQTSDILVVFSDTTTFGEYVSSSNLAEQFDLKELLRTNHLFCSSMYRKSDLMDSIFYDENLKSGAEDWEFWIQLYAQYPRKKFQKIDYQIFNYRAHAKGVSMFNTMTKEDRKSNNNYIYEKHKNLYNEYYPDYINILNRMYFYEKKLEKFYQNPLYKAYNAIMKKLK